MNDIINWKKCEREFIRKVHKDKDKITSISKTVEKRLKFLKSIKINSDNVSFIVEGYYEVIKELLVSLLLKHGLKSKNHQCLFSFFQKTYPKYEFEINLMLRMSYLRNRLNYYGELIESEFYEKNKEEFKNIIKLILKLVQE